MDSPTYDADGNLLTSSNWSYTWNGENRLVAAVNASTRLEFDYDYMGRRLFKKVYTNNVLTQHTKFAYDGYKLIAEFDALNNDMQTASNLWQPTSLDVPLLRNGEYFVSDGNKNIIQLRNSSGTVTDSYSYDPFGKVTHSGTSENPLQFSSEYHDVETDLVYYNYRYYSPALGRRINRDPIGEKGFVYAIEVYFSKKMEFKDKYTPYVFVMNNSINNFDLFGLDRWYYDALHTTLAVDVWSDDCKQKTAIMYIEFGPDHSVKTVVATMVTLSVYTPGLVSINYDTSGYSPSGYETSRVSTCCKADKELFYWAWSQKTRAARREIFYNWAVYNCRHFTAQGLLIGL